MCIRDRSRNARRAGCAPSALGVSRSRRCAAPRERAPTSPGRTAPPSGPAVRRRRSPAGELHVERDLPWRVLEVPEDAGAPPVPEISLIHISEPTRLGMISYAVFCLKKKKKENTKFNIKTLTTKQIKTYKKIKKQK